MVQENRNKTYLVFSVVALALLIVGAVGVINSQAAGSINSVSGSETTQDTTDTNMAPNDGKSTSDGDGETKDDNTK